MTIQQAKDQAARENNFDAFDIVLRYTFNRQLLPSEYEFITQVINTAMEIYAEAKEWDAFEAAREGTSSIEKVPVLIDQYGGVNIEEHSVWKNKYPTFEDYKKQKP